MTQSLTEIQLAAARTRGRLASTSIPSDKTKKKALSEAGFCSIR